MRPAGSAVASATPVSATVFAAGLVTVSVSAEVPPAVIVFAGVNAAAAAGGATTAKAPAASSHAVAAAAWSASPP